MLLLVTAAVKVQLKNVLQLQAFVHAFAAILGDQSVGTRAWRGLRFLKPKTLAQISGASLCKNCLKERPTPSGGLGLGFVTFSSVGQFFDWKTTRMHERSYS